MQAGFDAGALAVPTAHAHSYVEVSVDFLVHRSQRIALATPEDEMSVWEDTSGGRRIVTYHRVRIHENVSGKGDDEIWVRRLGGVVGDIAQRVHGTAPLQRGQTMLLFLTKRPEGTFSVVGMEQGCFPVKMEQGKPLELRKRRISHGPLPTRTEIEPASKLEGMTFERATRIIVEAKARHAK